MKRTTAKRTMHGLAILLLFSLLAVPAVSGSSPSIPLPHAFYGTVMNNDGTPAPTGTIIVASVRGVNSGSVTITTAGEYGNITWMNARQLLVQGPQLASGDPIAFYLDGIRASQTASYEPGMEALLNLTATAPLPKKRPSESTTEPVSPKAKENVTVNSDTTGTSVTLTTAVDLTNETIAFSAFQTPPDDQPIPSNMAPVGRYAEIESTITNDEIQSIIIRIYYTDADIAAAGINEDSLRVYYWNPASSAWDLLEGGVNKIAKYAWGETDHLSTFGILGSPVQPSPTQSGGGGHQAAGPVITPEPTPTPVAYVKEGPLTADKDGKVAQSVSVTAADGVGMLTVLSGVTAHDANGKALQKVVIVPVNATGLYAAGADSSPAGFAYACTPEGATFAPGITLAFQVSEDVWPTIAPAGKTLSIRWYNSTAGAWEELATTVSGTARMATARVTHFSTFALFSVDAPAAPDVTPTSATTATPTGTPVATGAETPESLPMAVIIIAIGAIVVVAAAAFFLKKQ